MVKLEIMSKRRVFYDKKADVLYFVLKEGQEEYVKEIQPNVIVEFNKDDEVIGIEILKASEVLKRLPETPENGKNRIYRAFPK